MNINEHSTKTEIVDASLEYIDHVERTTFTHRQTAIIATIALLIGWFAS